MSGRAQVVPKKARAVAVPTVGQINQREADAVEERIRRRAHAIYVERGGQEGSAIEDWLQAEREIQEAQGKKDA